MSDEEVQYGLFGETDEPTVRSVWYCYKKGLAFNDHIRLDDTIEANENFYVGKQWERVNSNGLPTPVVNFMKRVVMFIVATITSDSIKVNATPLANTPDTKSLTPPNQVVNEEFEALDEFNDLNLLVRTIARDAAVRGDGCVFFYWDDKVKRGNGEKGYVRAEVLKNNRVIFGDETNPHPQEQPYIQIASREAVRDVRMRAKEHGSKDWKQISSDTDDSDVSVTSKYVDDRVTTLLTMWRDEDTGEIWCYECTENAEIRPKWSLGIDVYPLVWLNWDAVDECYHGEAMITGMIPNQVMVNRMLAIMGLSAIMTAVPKVLYDNTRIKRWDNRAGGAIGLAGNVEGAAKIMEGAMISPQFTQFIQMLEEMTEQSLGATSVALGDTRPDNTSAIIALQRAASTPSEVTKQNVHVCIEDMHRIYFAFMAEYYGKRMVDLPPTDEERELYEFAMQPVPSVITKEFDFNELKNMPMSFKLDVGASSYYSEIAAMNTLDNLLTKGFISPRQYVERIPPEYIPKQADLLEELRNMEQMQQQMAMQQPQEAQGSPLMDMGQKPEINGGGGYAALQRKVNEAGTTNGIV